MFELRLEGLAEQSLDSFGKLGSEVDTTVAVWLKRRQLFVEWYYPVRPPAIRPLARL